MEFVTSGPAALEALAGQPFDVLVTDMRMPGMDGAELLRLVSEQHPSVVRIVLSGHADESQVVASVGLIHQFLAKPCEADTLRAVLERTVALQELLPAGKLRPLVSQTQALPALPQVYAELLTVLRDPRSDARAVGRLIARDLGMTAKVLQLVNSAFFALRRQVTSAEQAVAILGLETTRALVLSAHVFAEFDTSRVPGFDLNALSAHGLQAACFARAICRAEGLLGPPAENAFLAAMLHDLGKLILASSRPQEYGSIWAAVTAGEGSLLAAERESFGDSHAEVAAYLLGLWGLPTEVVEAVAFHHAPANSQVLRFEPLVAVHVANALANELGGTTGHLGDATLDSVWLERLGLLTRLEAWRAAAARC